MKKLINSPANYVDESLDGLCAAFPGYARTGATGRVIVRGAGVERGKVGVVTGGGFGHLPLFAGYVGSGLLGACAVGDVFAGPPADVCADAIRAADGGAGVVCVLGNYGGDRMSFANACDEVLDAGIETQTEIVADDVASAPPAEARKRRGVAGMIFAFKVAGGRAAPGPSESLLDCAIDAAAVALEQFRGREAKLGRARMYGAKSVGLDDPGMLAVYLVLAAAGERAVA